MRYGQWLFLLVFFDFFGPGPLKAQNAAPSDEDYFGRALAVYRHNLDSSIYYFRQGIPYYLQQKDWVAYVNCHNGLSSCYYQKGDFQQSQHYVENAIELARQHLQEDNNAYSSAINNLAAILFEKGNYEAAIDYYQKALVIEKKYGTHKGEVSILNNLGDCFFEKGDFGESGHYLQRGLDKNRQYFGEEDPQVAYSYIKLANLFSATQQQDSARFLYQQSIQLLSQTHIPKSVQNANQLIVCHLHLAEIFLEKADWPQMHRHITAAQKLSEKTFQRVPSECYRLRGKERLVQEDFQQAKVYFQQAIILAETEFAAFEKTPSIGNRYQDLAQACFAAGDFRQSLEQYQEALRHFSADFLSANLLDNPNAEKLFLSSDLLRVLEGKARTLHQLHLTEGANSRQNYLQGAQATYQLANAVIQKVRQSFWASASKELLAGQVVPIYEGALETLYALYQQKPSDSLLNQAFQLAESSKAILLLESIHENTAKGFAGIPDSLLNKEKELLIDIGFHHKKIALEKSKALADQEVVKLEQLEDRLFTLRRAHQQLIEHFEENYPRYFQLKYATEVVNIPQVQQLLDSESALVEYFLGERALYRFHIETDQIHWQRQARPNTLGQDIYTLKKHLSKAPPSGGTREDFQEFTRLSYSLWQTLLQGLELDDDLQRLIVIPDDLLAYLPFELLLTGLSTSEKINYGPGHLDYLLERFAISYNYSASLWKEAPPPHQSTQRFIGFAPGFAQSGIAIQQERNCSATQLFDLQCNDREVAEISSLLRGLALTEHQATKELFLQEAPEYQIIHLATHACVDDQNPMLNKIFFVDDYLSNYDLFNLNLKADLAVLSACNTGSGKLLKGEGIMSLSRGFLQAGCPSTLISLWSVDDCTTSDLMIEYYRNLKKGLDKDLALQNAKLHYLNQSDKLHAHPYYWAAFVQFGNLDALVIPSRFHLWWLFAVLILLGGLGAWWQKKNRTNHYN